VPALWRTQGAPAGPIRNGILVEICRGLRGGGRIVHCHAFPLEDSVGTYDCLRLAREAGFPYRVHGDYAKREVRT
jgi:hypothetical protein